MDPEGLKGWYCQRSLGGKPGTKGPPLFNHQYICVTSGNSIICSGLTTDGDLLSSDSRRTRPDEDYYDPNSCEEKDDDEECILRTFKYGTLPRYGIGPFTDCQEYADDLYYGCKISCSVKKNRQK